MSDLEVPVLGWVPTTGRGSLPFALLHGEPLVVVASAALERAGAELVDFTTDLAELAELADLADQEAPPALVLHDPLCPLTPPAFLREAIELAVAEELVVVGAHPVSDTIKRTESGVVGETVDREQLWALASPIVLSPAVLAALTSWPDADDVTALVEQLRERAEVRFLEAPALARRVVDESSLELLEALAAEEAEQGRQAELGQQAE
jgi:2-C-methyl-D-erythritol 4-phosphate cytidylyltransferase